jgi:hypothetical protein
VYNKKATAGLKVHVRTSPEGFDFDTTDYAVYEHSLEPGKLCRSTHTLDCSPRFIKIIVENPDQSCAVEDVRIALVLKG